MQPQMHMQEAIRITHTTACYSAPGGRGRPLAGTAETRCEACVINAKLSSVKGLDEWIRTQHFVCVRVCITYLHLDLHTTMRELLNHAFNPYERLHLSVEESERTRSEG